MSSLYNMTHQATLTRLSPVSISKALSSLYNAGVMARSIACIRVSISKALSSLYNACDAVSVGIGTHGVSISKALSSLYNVKVQRATRIPSQFQRH